MGWQVNFYGTQKDMNELCEFIKKKGGIVIYEDGQELTVYSEYEELIIGLMKHGKEELVKKVFDSMNEHFIKLRDSDREDERKFFPGKTAEEMFLGDEY